MKFLIKDLASRIPYPVSKFLVNIPFSVRLGREYTRFSRLIEASQDWSSDQKLRYTIERLNFIIKHAQKKNSFYRNLYREYGVNNLEIKDISDFQKFPSINKAQLRESFSQFTGYKKFNTGGTSGEPFAFYLDSNSIAREWAHMHKIWELKSYNFTLPKITLRGKNLGIKIFKYNIVNNEFIINTYLSFSERSNAIRAKDLIIKHRIGFVHGYPSAVYNFFKELESTLNPGEVDEIKEVMKVALLGSEFPLPHMVDYLCNQWGLDHISWYGHSEMCILAYDLNKSNTYIPFSTYGFSEVISNELIGTSFHNTDMPLIRYQTGDLVTAVNNDGLLDTFSITEGRAGDFIEDRLGKKIPLTALIFGRHHKGFELFDFIQVKQREQGKITLLITSRSKPESHVLKSAFDFSDLNLDVEYQWVDKPVLSAIGKFKLKV